MPSIFQIIPVVFLISCHLKGVCSAFMSEQESDEILELFEEKDDDISFKLSGVLYFNEENWTIWINDIPYSTIGQKELFSIDAVFEDSVDITLQDGRTIHLQISTVDEE